MKHLSHLTQLETLELAFHSRSGWDDELSDAIGKLVNLTSLTVKLADSIDGMSYLLFFASFRFESLTLIIFFIIFLSLQRCMY